MSQNCKTNNSNKAPARRSSSAALKRVKRNIYWQAGLAVTTIMLTIVIVFAMTSAWYTNIVQTSGLVFEAESWGFDGIITVNEEPIVASPGDEGNIHLEVQNTANTPSAISINISKARMIGTNAQTEMQKRLYFYVDSQMTRNGETVERIYLNNQEGYTYTVFGQSSLVLTEDMHNDVQLKWMWVYDMLGYYVLGQWNEPQKDEAGVETVPGYLSELEYLRPIEYNFDEATTTFREVEIEGSEKPIVTMELDTVDGTMTVEEFLIRLSESDGYEGRINPDQKVGKGYYPVDVDEDGYGVYAYLCNYAEIQMATQFDTALGEASAAGENPETFQVQLTISAQKNDENVVNISSLSGIYEAMDLEGNVVIQLSDDLTIPADSALVISGEDRVMLDLNGYTITSNATADAIQVQPGGSLTMVNGTIAGTAGKAITATGAELTMSEMTIEGFDIGMYVSDNLNGNALDSKVRLVDCEISGSTCAVFASGNGAASSHVTQVVIENSTLTSEGTALIGNGSDGRWGTDIQVINSTLTGTGENSVGIFHPQKNSTLTIYKTTVSAYTGVAIKGGTVIINESNIAGTGEGIGDNDPVISGSGVADTGDGIYIETNYGYDIRLEIHGGSRITAQHGKSLRVFEADADNVSVNIYSGVFDEPQPAAYIDENSSASEDGLTITINS